MIKLRNIGQYVMNLEVNGTMSVTLTGIAGQIVPMSGWITNIQAAVTKAASGVTSSRIDVNINNTSIFSATTTQISFAGTTGTASYGALSSDPTPVAFGDKITIDLDAVGVSHVGCLVQLLIDRTNPKATSTFTGTTDADLTKIY